MGCLFICLSLCLLESHVAYLVCFSSLFASFFDRQWADIKSDHACLPYKKGPSVMIGSPRDKEGLQAGRLGLSHWCQGVSKAGSVLDVWVPVEL